MSPSIAFAVADSNVTHTPVPAAHTPDVFTGPPHASSRIFRLAGLTLVLLFACIYWFTLDNGLQPQELHGGDLITHQYAQVQARPSNAPGYPLYTMGGWLWFHGWRAFLHLLGVQYPNPILILSSYSTLWALLALWLLYAVCYSLLTPRHRTEYAAALSLLIATFFGVTYFFWYYATTTEQYSSAVAQTLAIVYVYLHWERAPERRGLLYLLALLCGLSLAHMLTIAFIVPPLVLVVLWRDPALLRSPRAIALAMGAAALPLVSYLYVYVRGALSPAWWGRGHWDSPQAWFWSFVSTAQGRDELAWAFEPGRPFFGNGFPEMVWQELSIPILLLGLVGIGRLPRRLATMLYGTLLLYALFCWLYRFGNWFQVIIPAYPLILLGIVALVRDVGSQHVPRARLARLLVLCALIVSIIWRAAASLPHADNRDRSGDSALDRAAILLDQPLPAHARVFATVDDTLALNYLTGIWGLRPDVETLTSPDADAILRAGDNVLATVDATPALMQELSVPVLLDGLSPDWIVLSAPDTMAIPALTPPLNHQVLNHEVTPDLTLVAVAAQSAPGGAPLRPPHQPALDVTLTWQVATGVWPEGVAISVRPTAGGIQQTDPQTGHLLQIDRPRPLAGLWRDTPITHRPQRAIIIHDPYRVPQPASLEEPADGLLVILYRQTTNGFVDVAEIALPLPPH